MKTRIAFDEERMIFDRSMAHLGTRGNGCDVSAAARVVLLTISERK
jgi:hypothetical protein